MAGARGEFDAKKRDVAISKLHERVVDQAAMLFVVHDTGPRALSPKVKGFVQSKNWFQDLSPAYIQ